MPYIPFTEEQKLRANSVDLVEFLRRQGEKLIPSCAGIGEKSSGDPSAAALPPPAVSKSILHAAKAAIATDAARRYFSFILMRR